MQSVWNTEAAKVKSFGITEVMTCRDIAYHLGAV